MRWLWLSLIVFVCNMCWLRFWFISVSLVRLLSIFVVFVYLIWCLSLLIWLSLVFLSSCCSVSRWLWLC